MSLLLSLLQAKLNSSGFDWIKVENVQLSPALKSLTADLKLAGENELIRFSATYAVTSDNHIHLDSLVASRQWLTEVAELVLAKTGRSFALPEGIKGKLVRLFL
jgi:hypothetical protein